MNSKKSILFGVIVVIILAGGVSFLYSQNQKSFSPSFSFPSKTVLVLTEEPQDAEFYIRTGWVGGGGNAPILDPSGSRPLRFNDMPIFFDESKVDEALRLGKMPDCVQGQPVINVSANITLTPRTRINQSIPPDSSGYQPSVSYYEAVVNKFYSVSITAEPCKD